MPSKSKIPGSRKEKRYSIKHTVCTVSMASSSYHLGKVYFSVGNCSTVKFPETRLQLILQPRLSKDGSLRPGLLTPLTYLYHFFLDSRQGSLSKGLYPTPQRPSFSPHFPITDDPHCSSFTNKNIIQTLIYKANKS